MVSKVKISAIETLPLLRLLLWSLPLNNRGSLAGLFRPCCLQLDSVKFSLQMRLVTFGSTDLLDELLEPAILTVHSVLQQGELVRKPRTT